MDTCHDPVVVADDGFTATFGGPAAERAQLPDRVVVTDNEFRISAIVLFVLWFLTHRSKLKNPRVFPDCCAPGYDNMWSDPATWTNGDLRANDAERTDLNVICNIGSRVDQRLFMNSAHFYLPAQRSSQLATRFPSTLA